MILEKTPTGRNGLATDLLFKERLYYREKAFPKYGPRPIDMWYEKPYYGKVETNPGNKSKCLGTSS